MYPHAKVLCSLIEDTIGEPKVGCEVGIWQGVTAGFLLKSFDKLRLLMVDRYKELNEKEKTYAKVIARATQKDLLQYMSNVVANTMFASDRRILLVCSSLLASEIIQDGSLDFVFIDAAHNYDSVLADLHHWYPKVRSGGLVSGHD